MPGIPNETIEQVAGANDIVEVIGSYFPLKRAGANYKALCPFHQEKTPSFTVSPARQTFHCFGCGVGGSVFRFVMEYEHVDFPAAVRRLASRVGITVVEERSSPGESRQRELRATLLRLHSETAAWFHENLLKSKAAEPAREYLKHRGIDKQIAQDWQLGFSPESWDAFSNWASQCGYSKDELLASGLAAAREEPNQKSAYDRFRGRIMFPICNDIGEVIAFSGRTLKGDEGAKYVNSPETPLFRKGSVLFGLHKSKRALIEAKSAIVCEGQLDLITIFEAGLHHVVAPQGTAFTETQARVLKRYVSEVVLCFDADTAGQKAAERSIEALLQNELIVRVAELPAGEDPDSLIRKDGRENFEQRIASARDFFDVWLEREIDGANLDSLGAKMQLARRLAETVSRVPDRLMRDEVGVRVSARVGVAPREFQRLIPSRAARLPHEAANDRPRIAPAPRPPHEIELLCVLALRDAEAREFLLQQDWRDVLEQTPNAELLVRVLEGDIDVDDAASLNAFMTQLPPQDEALVSEWLVRKVPANGKDVAQSWWAGLQQAALKRQLELAEARMKMPRLSAGEEMVLQKQIVDLRKQLDEISALLSARVLGS